MNAALARIALRYIAAGLVTYGIVSADIGGTLGSDPDILVGVEIAVGALIAAAVEGWYVLAKRFGWAT
jgi:preprotein translocase subunit Sec61beta